MKKRVINCIALGCAAVMIFSGCSTKNTAFTSGTGKTVLSIEAEEGVFTGNVKAIEDSSYSDGKYVSGFQTDDDMCTLKVNIAKEGFYDLNFVTASADGNHKENFVVIDGVKGDVIENDSRDLTDNIYRRVYLSAGEHEIGLQKYWGYINFDKLEVLEATALPKDMYKVSASLVNPNASDNAKRVMSFLTDIYGKQILSGQYSDGGIGSWEIFQIKANNGGKTPAVVGLEMGHCCQTAIDNSFSHTSVKNAMDAWEQGAIITMCYHWLAPEKYINGIWWNGFRSEAVDIPLDKIMNGEDEEGMQLILNDIEILAGQLQELEDAGVPVLWRPLHEASGGWFWWGEHGPDTYKKLYVLMYDQLTNVYGLDNLIWVWNGQDKDWYPGDEYVDIIGTDIYPGEQEYSSHINYYLELKEWLGETNKMIVMSENGTMPDIDACVRDGSMWGFFATWGGEFVISEGFKVAYSEEYTDKEMMNYIYNHEKVLTLEELPDLKSYKIHK